MMLDAFVFESDHPRARAMCSMRIATDEEIDLLITEIRKQGNARKFPFILKKILSHAVKSGCRIEFEQFEHLDKELAELKATNPQLRKFKHDLLYIVKTARDLERPIIF